MIWEYFLTFISSIFWGVPIAFVIYTIYVTDFHRICLEKFKHTSKRIKNLKGLVSTQYSGLIWIIFYTFKMILKTAWVNFLQYMNDNVTQKGKHYQVSYVIRGKLYKILVLPKRGPPDILSIVDENYFDVTDDISPFFLSQETIVKDLNPRLFEKENLEFSTSNADVYTFSENDTIKLK